MDNLVREIMEDEMGSLSSAWVLVAEGTAKESGSTRNIMWVCDGMAITHALGMMSMSLVTLETDYLLETRPIPDDDGEVSA